MTSFVNVSVVPGVSVLPPLSAAITASVGASTAPVDQARKFESYGPPAGVLTVLFVKGQCVPAPTRALNWLAAGPEAASATEFRIANEHLPAT